MVPEAARAGVPVARTTIGIYALSGFLSGLAGVATPISDIGMIFLNDVEPMLDANVRKAAAHAIDKQLMGETILPR